ncbi:hypothetical protein [Bacillus sp. JJ722]|uniref:hypothetical protein n=1 Tax=Bacillus sp. JJ722 TaxID=3122973 RepID=UPI002FFDA124
MKVAKKLRKKCAGLCAIAFNIVGDKKEEVGMKEDALDYFESARQEISKLEAEEAEDFGKKNIR